MQTILIRIPCAWIVALTIGTNFRRKRTVMADIYNEHSNYVGWVKDNDDVCKGTGAYMDYIKDNGDVCDESGSYVGYVKRNGDVCSETGDYTSVT